MSGTPEKARRAARASDAGPPLQREAVRASTTDPTSKDGPADIEDVQKSPFWIAQDTLLYDPLSAQRLFRNANGSEHVHDFQGIGFF